MADMNVPKNNRLSALWWVLGALIALNLGAFGYLFLVRENIPYNERAAIGACKTIAAAQTDYNGNSNPNTYARELWHMHIGYRAGNVTFMEETLGRGVKSGYTFMLEPGAHAVGSYWAWSATAWPLAYGRTGFRSFYVDESGVIRVANLNGAMGTITMPILD